MMRLFDNIRKFIKQKDKKESPYNEFLIAYEKIFTLYGFSLYDYLKKVDYNYLQIFIADDVFLDYLFKEENHDVFIRMYQDFMGENKILSLNEKMVDLIIKDKLVTEKLNTIMFYPCFPDILARPEIYRIICNSSQLRYKLCNASSIFGEGFFNYVLDNNVDLKVLSNLNTEVEEEIFFKKENYERLCAFENKNFIFSFSPSVIYKLIEKECFKDALINMNFFQMASLIKNGFVIPTDLGARKIFRDLFVQETNVYMYRYFLDELKINNLILGNFIEEEKDKYYDSRMKEIESNGLLKDFYNAYLELKQNGTIKNNKVNYNIHMAQIYKDDRDWFDVLKEYSDKELTEIFIDRMYKDNPYNFFLNLKNVLNFNKVVDNPVVPKDRLQIYNKVYNYCDLSLEDKIALYNELKDKKNTVSEFYDDYRLSKNASYKMLNESVIKLSKMKVIDNYQGVDIYALDGEKFNAYVHCTSFTRYNTLHGYWKKYNNKSIISLSFIGDKNTNTFYDADDYILLGFESLDIDHIIHVFPRDSFSEKTISEMELNTQYVNSILTPDQLIDESSKFKTYNEIIYQNQMYKANGEKCFYKALNPSYVMAYNQIKEGDIACAKELGIPIVLLNKHKYNHNFDNKDDKIHEDERYINTDCFNMINNYVYSRKKR